MKNWFGNKKSWGDSFKEYESRKKGQSLSGGKNAEYYTRSNMGLINTLAGGGARTLTGCDTELQAVEKMIKCCYK